MKTTKIQNNSKANLYKIKDTSSKKVLIFVHGFNGNHFKTWYNAKEKKHLYDFIIEDIELETYDIYTFGYKTGLVGLFYNFESIAEILYTEIEIYLASKKEIVIISHSQGGLIAQKLSLIIAERNPKLLNVIRGNIFLAVPFEGSVWGNIVYKLNNQVSALREDSEEIKRLKERWMANNLNEKFERIILCGARDKVVNVFSANPEYLNTDNGCYFVDEDHIGISKISKNSSVYLLIKKFLKKELPAAICNIPYMSVEIIASEHNATINKVNRQVILGKNVIDFDSFPRKMPTKEQWEKIIGEIVSIEQEWTKLWSKNKTVIRLYTDVNLSISFIIGRILSVAKGINLQVVQEANTVWDTKSITRYDDYPITVLKTVTAGDNNVAAIVLAVSLDIKDNVQKYLQEQQFNPRIILNISPKNNISDKAIANSAQANIYAQTVKNEIEKLMTAGIKEIHLFMSMPKALTIIVGHKLSGVCAIQLYEYVQDLRYKPVYKFENNLIKTN